MSLVSIVIPSYNHERYIEECLSSVVNQSHSNLEIIVIDDGSQDNSCKIIESFSDQRISLFKQDNQGAHQAINNGLSKCKGDYICILNSDDYFHPHRISTLLKVAQDSKSDFVVSSIQIVDSKSRPLEIKRAWHNALPWQTSQARPEVKDLNEFEYQLLQSNFTATTSNFFFRKFLLNSIGDMRPLRYCHDWDFALRAAIEHKAIWHDEALINYRLHGSNTIKQESPLLAYEIGWIWKTYSKEILGDLSKLNKNTLQQLKHCLDINRYKLAYDIAIPGPQGLPPSKRALETIEAKIKFSPAKLSFPSKVIKKLRSLLR